MDESIKGRQAERIFFFFKKRTDRSVCTEERKQRSRTRREEECVRSRKMESLKRKDQEHEVHESDMKTVQRFKERCDVISCQQIFTETFQTERGEVAGYQARGM